MTAVLLAGCGETDQMPPAPAPIGSRVPSLSASYAAIDDPPGSLACAALASAIADGSLMTAGVADGIGSAAGTADAPVADAAERLASAYSSAVTAVGTDMEPDAVAAVSAAASDMSTVCSDSGLKTVG